MRPSHGVPASVSCARKLTLAFYQARGTIINRSVHFASHSFQHGGNYFALAPCGRRPSVYKFIEVISEGHWGSKPNRNAYAGLRFLVLRLEHFTCMECRLRWTVPPMCGLHFLEFGNTAHVPTFCAELCRLVTNIVWHVAFVLGHPSPPRRHHCTMGVIRDAVVWKPY